MTVAPHAADFLLGDAAQRHAGSARLAALGPVHRVTLPSGGPAWLVVGYDEVRRCLADTRLEGRTGAVADRRGLSERFRLGMNNHMLNREPPDHTRLRRLISAAFTRRRMEDMRPRIERIADDLLDAMAGADEVDLVAAYALPLPIRVLGGLLGIPESEDAAFHRWTTTLTASALSLAELEAAAGEMLDYTQGLLRDKRRAPGDDLLSALASVRDGGDRLTEDELTSMVFLLLIAGHETTVNLIGNAMLALLTDRPQLERLRTDPDLVPDAVEEVLRYESPVQVAARRARQPVAVGGATIPAGAVVLVSLLAANRDPERFAEPATLRIDRPQSAHVAFGHGLHHCIGAPLARLDATIAIRALVRRYPHLRLAAPAESLVWRASVVMHGLDALPVRLH
ncbi:cytochrome P450 family protein [Micromonospora sp. CA-269861]|uniref:cytochrome P450 family protein n=1 Tax=Micromonospora sp. CA-269861 TaxID=3239968 RepID=UPI003D8E0931